MSNNKPVGISEISCFETQTTLKERVLKRYSEGATRKQILDEFNIPTSTYHSWIRELSKEEQQIPVCSDQSKVDTLKEIIGLLLDLL